MKNMRSTWEEILLVHSGHRNNVLHSLISHVAVKRFPFSFLWCFCSNRDTVFQNNTFCRNRQTCHVLLLKKKKKRFPTFKDFFCRFHNFCSKTRCLKPEMSNSCLQRLSSIYLFFCFIDQALKMIAFLVDSHWSIRSILQQFMLICLVILDSKTSVPGNSSNNNNNAIGIFILISSL